MDDYPKVLDFRENSSMASTWTEHLRLSVIRESTALLEVCMYEALAEAPGCDDSDEEPVVPEEINVVGGDLCCIDDQSLTFNNNDIERTLQWLTARARALFELQPKHIGAMRASKLLEEFVDAFPLLQLG
jgi:hypothetical protein